MLRKLWLRKLIAVFIFLGRSLIPCHFYIFRELLQDVGLFIRTFYFLMC